MFNCPICKEEHAVYKCSQFIQLSPKERMIQASKASLCLNCLRPGHAKVDCRLGTCRKCQKQHNTLLHFEKQEEVEQNSPTEPTVKNPSSGLYHVRVPSQIYLATAVVDIFDNKGQLQPCRVMIDGGAQSCAITDSCVSRLGLQKKAFEIPLLSIDDMNTKIKYRTFTTIHSRFFKQGFDVELLVVKKISDALPSFLLNREEFNLPENIHLADPRFYEPAPVDIIIGAEFAFDFLLTGRHKILGHEAILQETKLGWIIAGRVYGSKQETRSDQRATICNFLHNTSLPLLWELDQVKPSSTRSKDEQECEKHFIQETRRDDDGRYEVKLPLNEKINHLGE